MYVCMWIGDLGFDPMGQLKGKSAKQIADLKLKEIVRFPYSVMKTRTCVHLLSCMYVCMYECMGVRLYVWI